jgi:hypothetical protein
MAYDFYVDKVLLPVTPSKLQIKVKNQNKTIVLIDEGEINLLKKAGLTDISFTALIPQVKYPFAQYKSGFQGALFYLDAFENLKTKQEPFQFIVSRTTPNGKVLFDSNIKVSLEDYKISEDAKNGFDLSVEFNLKQFRPYATKTVQITIQQEKPKEKPKAVVQETRPAETAPKAKTHTVVKGDSLWAIAQKYLGNGNRYPDIYKLNQSAIDARNKGTGNPKYTIYPNQVFTIPS